MLDLHVVNSQSTTFSGAVNAGEVEFTYTDDLIAFEGDTTISTGLTVFRPGWSAGVSLSFTGTTNLVGGHFFFWDESGSVTLGDEAGDSILFAGGVSTALSLLSPLVANSPTVALQP